MSYDDLCCSISISIFNIKKTFTKRSLPLAWITIRKIGTMLPCNVTIQERVTGQVEISAWIRWLFSDCSQLAFSRIFY